MSFCAHWATYRNEPTCAVPQRHVIILTFFRISLNFKAHLDECTALNRHLKRRNCARIKLHSKQFSMTISWCWNITLGTQECFETVSEYSFVRRLLRFVRQMILWYYFKKRQVSNPLSDVLLINHFHKEEFASLVQRRITTFAQNSKRKKIHRCLQIWTKLPVENYWS